MKSRCNRTNRLKITYPQKPGFTLLAHQIFTELTEQFNISGVYEEDKKEQFTVILDNTPIYTCNETDKSKIDRQQIIDAVIKTVKPVSAKMQADRKRVISSEYDFAEYPDCFCSGE